MRRPSIFTATAGLALTLWAAWVFQRLIFQKLGLTWEISALGQWGDTFGALNALFAGAGFAAVLLTLLAQRKALQEQQNQIDDARLDQHRQRFESSYFELIRLLRGSREEVRFRYSDEYLAAHSLAKKETKVGPAAFRAAALEMSHWFRVDRAAVDAMSKAEMGGLYARKVHRRYETGLGTYFRLVYTILKRIHDDKVLTLEEKARYGNLLRSQLTSVEAALAGFNGLATFSGDFFDLVVEFRLLKYLPSGKRRTILKRYYPATTFEGRPKPASGV